MTKSKNKWGFLASSRETAKQMEKKYRKHFTPLIDYMKVIFPDIDDWEEDKKLDLADDIHIKPDLYSHKNKKIIKLLQKNKKLDFNQKDVIKCGYEVYVFADARQLTNTTVKQIFGVNVSEPLFDENTPTLTQPWIAYKADPYYGKSWYNVKAIYRGDIKQYNVNINAIINSNKLTLNKIIIEKLFDLYTYEIDLNTDKDISILIGPNGCGKTTILTIIQLMLTGHGDIKKIIKIPFKKITCILSNGNKVRLQHSQDHKKLDAFINNKIAISFSEEDDNNSTENKRAYIDLLSEKNSYIQVFFQTTSRLLSKIDRLFGKTNKEKEDKDTEVQTFRNTISKKPDQFQNFCDTVISYYETEKSDREHDLFEQYMSANNNEKLLSNAKFEKEWKEFSEKRNEYEQNPAFYPQWRCNLNLLSEDKRVIEQYKKGYKHEFLCTYLRLFKGTLPELEKAHKKTMLFQEIINDMFKITKKQLHYRYQEMYLTVGEGRERKEIDFDMLSSGEKHIFIMFINLIFGWHDCMFLIDEPEISLHIEWQEHYIDNLIKICRMNNIQALVATHSPNIINNHTDLIAQWEILDE